jgi:hypothetical protein|tara:strand:+ start:340 stop:501 length:162 start_codon:yes stop_codon:yes gene_type:complete
MKPELEQKPELKSSNKVELIQVTKQMSLQQIKANLLQALKRQGVKVVPPQKKI